jgi:hypothetical protein
MTVHAERQKTQRYLNSALHIGIKLIGYGGGWGMTAAGANSGTETRPGKKGNDEV